MMQWSELAHGQALSILQTGRVLRLLTWHQEELLWCLEGIRAASVLNPEARAASDRATSASARPDQEQPSSSSPTSDTPAPKPERSSASEPENQQ